MSRAEALNSLQICFFLTLLFLASSGHKSVFPLHFTSIWEIAREHKQGWSRGRREADPPQNSPSGPSTSLSVLPQNILQFYPVLLLTAILVLASFISYLISNSFFTDFQTSTYIGLYFIFHVAPGWSFFFFLNRLCFLEHFKVHSKIERRDRDFPYTSCPTHV